MDRGRRAPNIGSIPTPSETVMISFRPYAFPDMPQQSLEAYCLPPRCKCPRLLPRPSLLTQVKIAKKLGIGQEGVSRIEQRSDLLISTLRAYVETLGGKLSIVAEFPDRVPVILTGLATMDKQPKSQG
jgi:hypothetical protein